MLHYNLIIVAASFQGAISLLSIFSSLNISSDSNYGNRCSYDVSTGAVVSWKDIIIAAALAKDVSVIPSSCGSRQFDKVITNYLDT